MPSTIIRHSSAVKPISVPVTAEVTPADWDRVQTFSPATSQPSEKLYEIGRLAKMTTSKDTLEASLSITQMEYGKIDSFLQLANLSAEPVAGLALTDFSSAKTDFYLPGKDEYAGTVEQTLWLQKMVLDSMTIEMNANERIQRTFEMSGDFCKIARYTNKYVIFVSDTVASGEAVDYEIDLSDPAPVVTPNTADTYILQLYRIRSGTATQITSGYTYSDIDKKLTIASVLPADVYRIWYTAGSYSTAGDPTALNDDDDYYIKADNCTVTVDDGTNDAITLTQLTSLSIQATLNRNDAGAIGTAEKIFNEVENYDVTLALGGYVKNSTIQEALMTQAGQNWAIIDYSLFSSVDVTVKVYQESTKTTFMIGYKVTGCDFSDDGATYNANEFAESPVNLNSDNLLITEDAGKL